MASSNEETDIELGVSNGTNFTALPNTRGVVARRISSFLRYYQSRSGAGAHEKKIDSKMKSQIQIEDYRNGYPRFAALMAAHDSFSIFRRFSTLRTRLILLAQDKLTVLEDRLNKLDQEESSPLFLACSRKDRNSNREDVILQIQTSLSAYDELMEGCRRVNSYESPPSRLVLSLQNWLRGNACIARNEAAFLDREDLLALSCVEDGAVSWIGETIHDSLVRLGNLSQAKISRDRRVHVFPRSMTTRVARITLAPLIIFLLLAPVIICNAVVSLTARLATMVIATSIFVTLVSLVTKAKTVELAVAGATYTTVLVVFISGPIIPP